MAGLTGRCPVDAGRESRRTISRTTSVQKAGVPRPWPSRNLDHTVRRHVRGGVNDGHRHDRAAELVPEATQTRSRTRCSFTRTSSPVGSSASTTRIPREGDGAGRHAVALRPTSARGRWAALGARSSAPSAEARDLRERLRSPRGARLSRRSLGRSGAASRFSLWKTIATRRARNAAAGLIKPIQRLAESAHLTGRRLLEPGGELEERALAGPGRPEDRYHARPARMRTSRPRSATVFARARR